MGLFDNLPQDLSKLMTDVGNTAKEVAEKVADKSSDLASDLADKGKLQAKLLKLRGQISGEKKLLLRAEAELGRQAYENHSASAGHDLTPAYEKISAQWDAIHDLEQKVTDLKREYAAGGEYSDAEAELIDEEIVIDFTATDGETDDQL